MSTSSNIKDNIVQGILDGLGLKPGQEVGVAKYPSLALLDDIDNLTGGPYVKVSVSIATEDSVWAIAVVDAEPGDEAWVMVFDNGHDEPEYYDLESV